MEWISIDDRLPEYNKTVLIYSKTFGTFCGVCQRITRHVGENSPIDSRWFAIPGWGHNVKPTHWAPIPAPPKSEET